VSADADGPLLGQERIRELLVELGRRCAADEIAADMFIVGGAAIALAYSESRATRDIDAVFEPKMRVYDIAKLMADELGLPRDWLNDGVKGLLPDFEDQGQEFTFQSEGIRIVTTADQAYGAVDRYYRPERVSAKAGFFIQAIYRGDAR
jgi:hypothetical protein